MASCPAQQVTFNRVSQPVGSFSGVINAVSQDSLGYMWFAVHDRGLYRSDGYHLVTYQHDPSNPGSLATNAIELVYADHNGIIWVGTESGLDRLDPNTDIFTHFRHKAHDIGSLSDDGIKAILEDHEGTLWVGTMNGLNRLDQKTGTFTRYLHSPNDSTTLSWNQVQVLCEDRHNTLWVGTASFHKDNNKAAKEGGLNRFDRKTGKFTRFLHNSGDPGSLIDNRVGAIFEDSKGNFWVCTAGNGLHSMDRQTGKFERHRYDPAHPWKLSGPPRRKDVDLDMDLFFIQEDGSGAIWIGASGGWITRYDPTTKKVTHHDSFNGDTQAMQAVSGGFTSRDGILWITTWSGYVYRVDPFHSIIPHFLTNSIVHAIHEDVSGELWIGTLGKGLIRIDRSKGSVKRFPTDSPGPYSLSDSRITAIYGGDVSTLWIGSQNHLNRYDRKTQIFTQYTNDPKDETSLSKGWIVAIAADQPGSLWIATEEGLDHLDIKTKKFTHHRNNPKDSNSLSYNYVSALLKDHSGNLWVGTRFGGLNLFDSRTGKFRRFACGGNIGTILEDSRNIVWVGTSNGLYRSNQAVDTFSLFTDPGFIMTATTMITGILEDNQKNLWVASSAGIFRFNAKRNEIKVYNKNHGVDASGLSSVLMRGKKGRKGELFFGDRTGYYAFFPDQFKINTTVPQIVINDFRLADQAVKPGKGSPLNLPLSQIKVINLNYNQNDFSFDFAGIHYSSPEDNQHLFMLENLETSWRKAGSEKTAYYYNVPPGRYIFRLKAANGDGVWAEKDLIVIISPPWYRTWWAYVVYAVAFAAFIWIFAWYRSRRLKAENLLLEKKVINRTQELEQSLNERYELSKKVESQQALLNERLRISRELHDDIGSTLGSISIYSEVAKKRTEKNENTNEVLSKIGFTSRELIDKMSDIVWSLNPNNEGFEQLQNRMMAFAAMMLAPRNIMYDFMVGEELKKLQLTSEQRKNIFLIFKEALYNIVKYADSKTVSIKLIEQNIDVIMLIQDDGKGFNVAQNTLNEILPPGEYLGGNGIKNMHARADVMNATLCIQSKINEGTTVQLTLHL